MNKIGVLSFIILIFALSFVSAETNDTDTAKIDKAYQCLESATNNKTSSSLSLQEAIFSVYALGSNTKALDKIENEKRVSGNTTCWPKASCTIKDTAQALMAYQEVNKNTDSIENYLISKRGPTTGLTWYLLVDIENHVPATCTVRYSGTEKSFTIDESMKLSGDVGGSCLSIISSGYWLEISNSCLDRSYQISCSESFLTTLLYTKSGSDTIYVSPNTQSAVSSGYTNESIVSRCFRQGTADCEYESSLWAALALDKAGVDIKPYLPYLIALAPDNTKYLPESFLYKLTNGNEHFSDLLQQQRSNQFWSATSSPYNKFYDTSLALLALQGKEAPEIDNAKQYLLNVQDPSGCWNNNNLRDTAFVLYSAWPDDTRRHTTSGGGNGTTTIESCETASSAFSCVSSLLACADAGGEALRNYYCSGSLKCCSVTIPQQTCAEQNGRICSSNQFCSGSESDSSDGVCCLGTCVTQTAEEDQCSLAGGVCQSTCSSDEEDSGDFCALSGDVCCVEKESESSGSSTWIYILAVLIILVALGIVFRKKIQLMLFKARKSGSISSAPVIVKRPSFPPTSPQTRYVRPTSSRSTSQDKEMDETLKKLKEMSK